MAVDWSHLPKEVMDAVCPDYGANGFRLDPETGYWVHAKCGKPRLPTCVEECDSCGKTFVPKYYEKIKLSFLGIECDTCDPPKPR